MSAVARVEVLVQLLDGAVGAPAYARPGDAGMDLHSVRDVVVEPGARVLIPTGVAIALPPGYVGLVNPRSGLALSSGVTVLNGPGTIDAAYRGEISVILINTDAQESCHIRRGDRIAQLLIMPVVQASLVEVSDLPGSVRSSQGFGSSGR